MSLRSACVCSRRALTPHEIAARRPIPTRLFLKKLAMAELGGMVSNYRQCVGLATLSEKPMNNGYLERSQSGFALRSHRCREGRNRPYIFDDRLVHLTHIERDCRSPLPESHGQQQKHHRLADDERA